ncbi:MAG: flavin reductase family protein [Pseudomonadota bacterium]
MFYEPKDGHGLPHNPYNAIVAPRPIAWISSRDVEGHENLAPYSFFNATAYVPPQVMFASTGAKPDRDNTKDTLSNIKSSGVFCINIVEFAARDVMNKSSGPWEAEVDEFDLTGLARTECEMIPCSRVTAAPASLECKVTKVETLLGAHNYLVMAEVIGIHLRDDCLKDGIFDATSFEVLARMGYRDYAKVSEVFELKRPGE